ncbi:MAG: phenylacetic acid degradation protein PaaN [Bacteroidia bacterium]|nr:phenylacetic acid degradation protein PaaN [Bacteroidia bacterium]
MSLQVTTATRSESIQSLINKHQPLLEKAIEAVHSRGFYAAYPESPSPKVYGEGVLEKGSADFQNQLGKNFAGLLQQTDSWLKAKERSPYTMQDLDIAYPVCNALETYVKQSQSALKQWRNTDYEVRAALLVESLEGVKGRFFELANATMHTTGQSFVMSFQASGPHANDRALETIALGLYELRRFPTQTVWEKPMGKFNIKLEKHYRAVPKGVALCIGCSTFPTWNTLPGLYANLITGNSVIVKPHPTAIYPIAIVVAELQKTFAAYGLDPNIVQLACDTPEKPITKQLCENKDVKLIDFTGSSVFGDYVESLSGKTTFTEKAGINSVILDSCSDLNAVMQNLAFSVSLYSGQMCTCPQNFFIPKSGIQVNGETVSYNNVVNLLTNAISGLATHEKMGPGILGAIQSDATYERVEQARNLGTTILLDSQPITNPEFPNARLQSPLVLEIDPKNYSLLSRELFGPVLFIIPTENTYQSVQLAKELAAHSGAISCGAYTTSSEIAEMIITEMSESYTPVSFNLTGQIFLNQHAGFSDFHVTGGNPAGNASLTNPEFITKRYTLVGHRINLQ